MTNKEISSHFTFLSKLMDIHGENSFRATSYSILSYKISQQTIELKSLADQDIFRISGIGETMGSKITELLATGKLQILEALIENTPEGILEMMKIKGIGPKKIHLIWKKMEIENVGELLYACYENRLLLYKGFGKKTQDNVIASIEFYLSHQDSFLYAQVEQLVEELLAYFKKSFSTEDVYITGDFARQEESVDVLDFVIALDPEKLESKLSSNQDFVFKEKSEDSILFKYAEKIDIKIYPSDKENLQEKIFITTGNKEFIQSFTESFPGTNFKSAVDETNIFQQAKIQYIPPFLRENSAILSVAKAKNIPQVIQPGDIRGIIHCHSNWSDGNNTIEALADACIKTGKEYLVLSDHSKSATYAQGLTEERIRAQHLAIDELNTKLSPFKIFKSIESDIVNDGNLDYSDSILSTFDLVIASVHSNLKMDEEKATKRLLKAIENPYTTILGHMTGRLLLSRRGYPLDHKKIIDACAANNVVIEINANPRRLDMRWQWISYALSKNVLLSINPDAHSIPEFDNTKYGVLVAQKGMVTAKNNLSSFSLKEIEEFLKDR